MSFGMARHSSIALVLLVAACAPSRPPAEPQETGQTFVQAMTIMCNVDRIASIDPNDDPIGAEQKRADYVRDTVTNGDAVYLRTMWSVEAAAERAKDMREKAAQVGIRRCPLADSLEHDG